MGVTSSNDRQWLPLHASPTRDTVTGGSCARTTTMTTTTVAATEGGRVCERPAVGTSVGERVRLAR